jgi:hypothetical protein
MSRKIKEKKILKTLKLGRLTQLDKYIGKSCDSCNRSFTEYSCPLVSHLSRDQFQNELTGKQWTFCNCKCAKMFVREEGKQITKQLKK